MKIYRKLVEVEYFHAEPNAEPLLNLQHEAILQLYMYPTRGYDRCGTFPQKTLPPAQRLRERGARSSKAYIVVGILSHISLPLAARLGWV